MKLLLIHQAFASPSDAGGTRHYELCRRLVERGHGVTIVAGDCNYVTGARQAIVRGLVSEERVDGIRVLRARTVSSLHRSYLLRVVSFLSFMATSVWASFKAGRADLVVATSPPIFQALSTWFVAAVRRRPLLLEIRDLWPEFAIDIGLLKNRWLIGLARRLERFLYARATHLLVNSPAYRDYLLRHGVPSEKISFVPNGVDPAMFEGQGSGVRSQGSGVRSQGSGVRSQGSGVRGQGSEVRGQIRDEFHLEGKFVVLYAGALGMANDIETILRAAAVLRHDLEIHFVLVGDGKERAKLEEFAAEWGLKNVTFAGARPKSEMPAVLAAADACVATLRNIPMFRTTYPNKVFDYMAAGKPVVLAIDGVIREVIETADAGLFVEPGNPEALAAAVRLLRDAPHEAREMGRRGAEHVRRHFNRNNHAQALEDLVCRWAPERKAA